MSNIYSKIKCSGDDRVITRDTPDAYLLDALGSRENLHNSADQISNRDWSALPSLPEGNSEELQPLREAFLSSVITNSPWPAHLDICGVNKTYLDKPGPKMVIEYGFGSTTYTFLEWCLKNDGYLVTVEMPIAKKEYREADRFPEIYYHGVDRYKGKYPHCIQLMKTLVAQKRWLWINDDIFSVTDRIVSDVEYRRKLFVDGKVDYFYEDAIHDDVFLKDLFEKMKPFMAPGSIFTGDDNCPTYLL